MTRAPAASSLAADALLAALVRRGVRHVVVCPGSRSQALALCAAEAERRGAVRVHVRLDERSAAFFALGIALETGCPAPVIVTSGTAAGNLLPAVLESHEARVPLLLLTADRPDELRGIRSNQTTRQAGLFERVARLSLDLAAPGAGDGDGPGALAWGAESAELLAERALAAAVGRVGGSPAGPVHLNLAVREPLSGGVSAEATHRAARAAVDEPPEPAGSAERGSTDVSRASGRRYLLDDGACTVVIAGSGAGPGAEAFAHDAGLPLLAEAVSGARFGRQAVSAYAALLDHPELGDRITRAIVFGHPTLTRSVPALLRRTGVETVVVDPHVADHVDPRGDATIVCSVGVAPGYDREASRPWLREWLAAEREARLRQTTVRERSLAAARETGYRERSAYARAELAALREPVSREMLAERLWLASWPHDRLVVAASRLVRVLDRIAPPRRVEVRANRGLAGIDGTLSTALGIAAASQGRDDPVRAAGATRVLIGDLAFLHDAGALLLPEGEARPRIQVLVGNDGGGTIFHGLEVAASAPPPAFERVMVTPQRVDLAALAAAYGWDYARVATRGELDRVLSAVVLGPTVIEVPLPRRL